MSRLAWLTDLHFNFLPYQKVDEFLDRILRLEVDGVVITGDISEAHDLAGVLSHMDDRLGCPLYFVLGNHDFYHGSIHAVRDTVSGLATVRANLHYLTAAMEPIELTPRAAIVGHDGWADARIGDYERSLIMMNDYKLIAELSHMTKQQRWPLLQVLGDAAAEHIQLVLPPALDR
ncbi:MAG: metallophosphoesterase, partial [Planctomycetota bacterium]|nr:metallophosphoesterase [Planctomycetota bacterium]